MLRNNIILKKSTKQYITVALISMAVIGGAAILTTSMLYGKIKSEYGKKLAEARQEMAENQRMVYIASGDIVAGEYLTEDSIQEKKVYASQPQKTYISSDAIGKLVLIDIPAGSHITNGMVSDNDISPEQRECQYQVINMNTNIISDNTVDVRIQYPNGESYVVISKKVIKGVDHETATCFFWLNEEELLRMSAAVVDAALYSGTQLVTTKYIEPSVQEASKVTYTPSLQVLGMIEKDPNIVERSSQELNKKLRKSLENRLADSLAVDVTATDWDVNDSEFVASAIQEDKTQADISKTDTSDNETVVSPSPTVEPQKEDELGSSSQQDYLYYADEEKAKGEVLEYGE